MQIPKPSQDDKDYFSSLVPADPDVEIKPMFGNLGAFVHGNMFAGLFGPEVGVRLRDEDRAALATVAGSGSVRSGRASDGRLPEPARQLAG